MFKKLLSNLPFNPSLIGQVSFYAKRLRREESIRRTGLVLLSLAVALQVFAVVSPPQPTLANSNNDMIDGGFSSRDEAVYHCQNNTDNYKTELLHFGITCTDVANAGEISLNSRAYNSNLFSMGELYYDRAGQTPVNIEGTTYWLRYLWSWDSYSSSTYRALQGTTAQGMTFFILFDCGNLVFIGVPTPPQRCPYNANLFVGDPACVPPKCPLDSSLNADDPRCEACPYDTSILKSNPSCERCPFPGLTTVPKTDARCRPCPYNNDIAEGDARCKPCEEAQTRDDKTACIEFSKAVRNDTQHLDNANGTTAKPGDTLVYTLSIENTGEARIDDYVVEENISDVLDYADVVNLDGGTKNDEHVVVWPAIDINAGATVQKRITVKVKDPIPSTPVSVSDPGHFDLTMTNYFGNVIEVKVPPTIVKRGETIVTTLPNTGPGQSLAIAFGLTAVVGYFLARSRLLVTEVDLVRADYVTSGGY